MDVSMPMDNAEFQALVAKQRTELGNFSEMIVAAELFRLGFSASKPLNGTNKGYDLIVDTGTALYRIQVKTITGSGQIAIGYTKRFLEWATGSYKSIEVGKYTPESFDFAAGVDRKTREVFLIPISDLDLSKAFFSLGSKRDIYALSHLSFQKDGSE